MGPGSGPNKLVIIRSRWTKLPLLKRWGVPSPTDIRGQRAVGEGGGAGHARVGSNLSYYVFKNVQF